MALLKMIAQKKSPKKNFGLFLEVPSRIELLYLVLQTNA